MAGCDGDVRLSWLTTAPRCRRHSLLSHATLLLLVVALGHLPCAAFASKIEEEPELAVEQVREEAMLEAKFARLKDRYGIEDRRTLDVFFELFDLWIMLYRLNKADAALMEVLPVVQWRRDDLTTKAVQALAFTRWKQGRFRESLASFHEMEGWMGRNAKLSENIGHTYNAIGAHKEADRHFKEALRFIVAAPEGSMAGGEQPNVGGVLLGMAGVQERMGQYAEAFPIALQAYNFYKGKDAERGWNTSLSAKAGMQVSKLHMKLGDLKSAETYAAEAVVLFEETAGDDSPLVAGALERLGQIFEMQDRHAESREAYHRCYKLMAIKDAFDLVEILGVHNKIIESHMQRSGGGLDRRSFRRYFDVVSQTERRVRRELPQDGNAAVYYKAAGELYVIGESCEKGLPLLQEAIGLFELETSIDTSGLIKQCSDLVAFCKPAGAPAAGRTTDDEL